ncbi:biopolymer transporter ExbD [Spirosoma sp.]|uniref:ExbD/TolR family protein n=1 Tax=Spirosoma sp. TaxID=1899569 RepID=UPI002637C08A|nr:biopolymer transporter ExbD [Spirosoma sp.]MCX6214258.1 biopolymer transporter ExbD [Spirosoma sp.]
MKTRRSYTPIRIDMTPFVSIALLLIVFFVWLKMVQHPNELPVELPDDGNCVWYTPNADASLFLLANNRIGFLTYRPDGSGAEFTETDYSSKGLRQQLMYLMPNRRTIVLITPTPQATFKNSVDALDELKIQGSINFRFSYEVTPGERKMLQRYEVYRASHPRQSVLVHLPLYPHRVMDV